MSVVLPPELDEGAVVAALVAEDPRPIVEAVVAEAPEFYAWWARPERLVDATPPIPPVHPPGASDDWALLYVGIAPKRPSKTGVDRTIAARVSKDAPLAEFDTYGPSSLRAAEDQAGLGPHSPVETLF